MRARLNRALDTRGNKELLKTFKENGIKLKDKDYAEIIAHVLMNAAIKEDMQAIKIILEHTEPPLPKDVNLNGDLNVTKIERVIIE